MESESPSVDSESPALKLRAFKHLPGLRQLRLGPSAVELGQGHDFPPDLESLLLDRMRVTRSLASQLALQSLVSLRLEHCKVHAAALRLPAGLRVLVLTGTGFSGLPSFPSTLETLDLSSSNVSKSELAGCALPCLAHLVLRGCKRVTSSVTDVLVDACPMLRELDVRDTRVRHVLDVRPLAQLSKLSVDCSVTVSYHVSYHAGLKISHF
jgi:hypothetical protein